MPKITPEVTSENNEDFMPAKIIYGLYAAGYFIGITSLAGVIYAYISRGKDPIVDTHLTFQIRTFWISFLIALVALITMFIGIGLLIFLFLLVWGLHASLLVSCWLTMESLFLEPNTLALWHAK